MAEVTKMNGEKGSTEGMYTHAFSGIPPGQYEFRIGDDKDTVEGLDVADPNDYVGSTFRLTVEVKLGQVAKKDLANGTEDRISLKVTNSGPLKLIERGHKEDKTPKSDEPETDPNQMTLDAAAGDWTDSTEGAPDDPDKEPEQTAGGGGEGKVTKLFSDGS